MEWALVSAAASLYVTGFDGTTELFDFKENNVSLTEVASTVGISSGEWYQDSTNDLLYLVASDDTNPNSNGYTYIGYTWLGFTNVQEAGKEINFEIQGGNEIFYEPGLRTDLLGSVRSSISDFWIENIDVSMGDIAFINTAWWYENRTNYLWHNADTIIKVGDQEDIYSSFVDVFYGAIKEPSFSDSQINFIIEDIRYRELTRIPKNSYNTTDYSDMNTDYDGYIIPLLFGHKENITPIEIDTTSYKYKICQTVFNGTTYAINSVETVYKDGVALSTPADYTPDLNNGEFTLVVDPGDSVITCDAKGIKCDYNFSTNTWTGNYSYNLAEIILFIINVVNNVPNAKIDFTEFESLHDNFIRECCDYIQEEIEIQEWFKKAQITGQFNIVPTVDGKITVKNYSQSAAPTITYESIADEYSNMIGFSLFENTKIYSKINVDYDEDPTDGTTKKQSSESLKVGYKYQQSNSFNITTLLKQAEDAADISNILLGYFKIPPVKVNFLVTDAFENFGQLAMDKIYVTRSIIDQDDNTISIFDNESFLILDIEKNLSDGTLSILAQKDFAQLRGSYLLQMNGDKLLQMNGDALLT